MDALFSIPMFSFLLIPTVASYSTSFNLLFFYLTWTTLVWSHPPLRVEIFGILAVRLLFYLLPSLCFFLFDTLLPSAAVVLKEYGKDGLPQRKKKKAGKVEAKVAAWSVFNLLLSIVLQGLVEYILTKLLGRKSALRVSTQLPLPWGTVKDILWTLLAREVSSEIISILIARWKLNYLLFKVLQYLSHRYILHSKSWTIARHHREWYHSLHTQYPLTAHYDHPLAYLFSQFIPTFLPAALFRCHLLTYMLYLVIISLEETFAYSGYKTMPISFFIGGIARRVDSHLASNGEGNFAALGIMDWIFGTTLGNDSEDEEESVDFSEAAAEVSDLADRVVRRRPRRSQAATTTTTRREGHGRRRRDS